MKKGRNCLRLLLFLQLLSLGGISAQEAQSLLAVALCPATAGTEAAQDHEMRGCSGFSLCYRESFENAEWVGYVLTKEKLVKAAARKNNFRSDPAVSTGSAEPDDYAGSGYDRGHLAPSADMTWNEESASESFLMSNMSPQRPQFNRGMWKNLEAKIRTCAKQFEAVYVITGPVLEKPAEEYEFIGKNRVAVPEFFYKAVLARDNGGNFSAAAFILPNEKCAGTVFDYIVSVNEAERRTGIDFFSALDDSIEEEIESRTENALVRAMQQKAACRTSLAAGEP